MIGPIIFAGAADVVEATCICAESYRGCVRRCATAAREVALRSGTTRALGLQRLVAHLPQTNHTCPANDGQDTARRDAAKFCGAAWNLTIWRLGTAGTQMPYH